MKARNKTCFSSATKIYLLVTVKVSNKQFLCPC